jgi:hypothetical protein
VSLQHDLRGSILVNGCRSHPNSTINGSTNSVLSNGATIAIAVLATALGLLLILAILYFWTKKRSSNRHISPLSDPPPAESVNEVARSSDKVPDTQPIASKINEFQVNEVSGKNTFQSAPLAVNTDNIPANELSRKTVLQSAETPELDAAHANRSELHGIGMQ